jgi:tetraacyldisaccharide 4'-kinase
MPPIGCALRWTTPNVPRGRRSAFADRIWGGDDIVAHAARIALRPAERLYAGIVGLRGILYDAGWFPSVDPVIPAISVGNLTVGGTGKTPIAAWLAGELLARGARPGIVLRGYGDDEPRVHELLTPGIPVVATPDRIGGIARARALGADVAVLDDAFQHRRARRVVDIVLVSADQWAARRQLLPLGPWREPLDAIGRASLVIVTRKAADEARVAEVHRAIAGVAPTIPRMSVHLAPLGLRRVGGQEERPLSSVRDRDVRVLVGIGDPEAFIAQMRAEGARVTATVYPDHHPFSVGDVAQFVRDLPTDAVAVCTLKDAVKAGSLWPSGAPPLWYVSQRVRVERGVGGIDPLLDEMLAARHDDSP